MMPVQPPDISQLLLDAKHNVHGARNQLIGLYRNYLRLLARNALDVKLQGKADPSDLVQETLAEAHLAFNSFQGQNEGEFLAWLRQILSRNSIDVARRYRSAARDVGRELSCEELPIAKRLQHLGDSIHKTPSQIAAKREISVLLADALEDLTADHRDVIIFRNLQELSWPEIGRRMNRNEEAVRKLWARALVNLKPLVQRLK